MGDSKTAILQMLLIDIVIIGITMEVLLRIIRAKIGAVSFCIVALILLVAIVIYDQVQYESGAETSLWTGVWVSAILTISYVTIRKALKARKSTAQPPESKSD